MTRALLIDFGSTFTKVVAADLERKILLGRAMAPTTVDTDINLGLSRALEQLAKQLGRWPEFEVKLACSSAAGGLRMVAVGLVPELTAEAAQRAALGAGARVLQVVAYRLTDEDLLRLRTASPDLILLAGGTDGGNKDVLLQHAHALTAWPTTGKQRPPVVVAGNREVTPAAVDILQRAGWDARPADNVMPRLGTLHVDSARDAIRQVFMERIVEAKGLQQAEEFVQGVLKPTPAAVLDAAEILAQGAGEETGLGELLVVDVGGATTDVHSITAGLPTQSGVALKGLPEPFAKRTVEGDLGVRVSAVSLVKAVGPQLVGDLAGLPIDEVRRRAAAYAHRPGQLPDSVDEHAFDAALAHCAVKTAVQRHAGRLETLHTPTGTRRFQWGKDLANVAHVIGTGGVLVHGTSPAAVLGAGLAHTATDECLLPRSSRLWIDAGYLLAPIGLLTDDYPQVAVRLLKQQLQPVDHN